MCVGIDSLLLVYLTWVIESFIIVSYYPLYFWGINFNISSLLPILFVWVLSPFTLDWPTVYFIYLFRNPSLSLIDPLYYFLISINFISLLLLLLLLIYPHLHTLFGLFLPPAPNPTLFPASTSLPGRTCSALFFSSTEE
jgi:hypothetical protein